MGTYFAPRQPSMHLRAELAGDDTCVAAGIVVTSPAPVLKLCRELIELGFDPATQLAVFRGDTLSMTVRSIGQAGNLEVADSRTGAPTFRRRRDRSASA